MRLAEWSLHVYELPYDREVVWSNARERAGLFALLKLISDSGHTGIAEGTIKHTWSGVSPRSLAAALEDVIVPALRGVDLADDGALYASLARIPENRLAKALVSNAGWTLRAAAAGKPLWQLLGGREEAEVCWTVTRRAPAEMAAESADYCARYGFRTLKVKGGQGVDTDLRALAEIRRAVPGVALYVDANAAYTRGQALDYVRRIAEAGATVAEDPSPIPILVDGSCTSVRDAELYLARGAKAVSLKPGRVGLSESRRIGERLGAAGAASALGIYAESALGTLVNMHLPATLAAEQSFFLLMRAQVVTQVPPIRGGRLRLPPEPDLSRLVDWQAVQRYCVAP
jgi:L-alanine-DL-glutamate epimerase-like enolase superfamily enzyme